MVIAQIIGGLGNQMFQYAAGRALSIRGGSPLALDISGFDGYGLHQGFELKRVFGHTFAIASPDEMAEVLSWQASPIIRRIVARKPFSFFCGQRCVVEPHFNYWAGIETLTGDCYLSGYWQSEKYFDAVAEQIRDDFVFRLPASGENAELAKNIQGTMAISLHVRRGDYANNPKTTATHGLCSLDYYQAAIQRVTQEMSDPYFYIFSDDINWARAHLKIDFPHRYVDHNQGAESYNDMRLMSLCRHHIIANSSFSWWGAWLNPREDKMVLAPKKWFANGADVRDLFPQEWIAL